MNNEEIKTKIIEAINIATKDKGYTLVKHHWGSNEDKRTCALGCVLVANDKELTSFFIQIMKIFGVSSIWVNEFISGYDNCSSMILDQAARDLGAAIAKQFDPPSFTDIEGIK